MIRIRVPRGLFSTSHMAYAVTDMICLFLIAAFAGFTHGFSKNAHLCDQIMTIDCHTQYVKEQQNEIVCGSDKNTYQNFCEYSKARCQAPSTHIAYIGPCMVTTTPAAATLPPATATRPIVTTASTVATVATTTVDPLMKVFCASKNSINCPKDLDPLCGSDGNFYLNKCEFSKMTCDNPSLTIEEQSVCVTG